MVNQLERSGEQEVQKLQDSLSSIGRRSLRWKTAFGLGIACLVEGGASIVFGLGEQNEIATYVALGAGFFGMALSLAGQCDVIEARNAVRASLKNPQ